MLAADLSLNADDYRCAERTFQLLVQAVGRAGRGESQGEAFIQTYQPEHYSIRAAVKQDYPAFYQEEIAYRMLMDYPPACAMMAVSGSGEDEEQLALAMQYIRKYIENVNRDDRLSIIGPADAAVSKNPGQIQEGIVYEASAGIVPRCSENENRAVYGDQRGIPEVIYTI